VRNAIPLASLSATTTVSFRAGGTLGISGSFTDKGVTDALWAYTISWSDGTSTSGTTSAHGVAIARSHAYRTAGTYMVSMKVRDKDGTVGRSATVIVTVAP